MDPRLLQYYNIELQHLREMGAEFAEQFPKIAARLGMNGLEVTDPYVERLLEGVGFLAARVHLKLDAEFPRFTQALLETIYPHYLAPTPSMLVAQFTPDGNEPGLASGVKVPRGTTMPAFERALSQALERTAAFGAEMLVLSFGADTFEGDPISHFAIRSGDFPMIGARIAALGLPTAIVMEGGYAVGALGENVAGLIDAF